MELYKVLTDEKALHNFIDWLPDLKDHEKFYFCLFARKKYCKELVKSNDKTQLKRFLATKENIVKKIKQLELPLGRWTLKDAEAPQESLVLYMLPNPRCMIKATQYLGKKCWDLHRSSNHNIVAEALSAAQKSKSRNYVVDFDVDDKEVDLNKIKEIFWENTYKGIKIYNILETRGGYHILVKPEVASLWRKSNNLNPNWFVKITEMFPVDQGGDQMIPVPGCIQGGFTPKFVL